MCILDYKGCWDDHIPLIEFGCDNSYHSNIKMAPYKALYGRKCISPIRWFKTGEIALFRPNIVHRAIKKSK